MRRAATLSIGAAVLLLTGCQTLSVYHTARPIPPGETELAFTGTAHRQPGSGEVSITPAVRLRQGLARNVDLGVNALVFSPELHGEELVVALGGAVDVNVMLLDLGLVAVSVDPTFSGTWVLGDQDGFYGTAHANLLVDLISTPVFSLTAGVRPGWVFVHGRDGDDRLLGEGALVGGLLGAKVSLLGLSVMPEVSVTYGLLYEETVYSAGVALMF